VPAAMERSPAGLKMLRNYNLSAKAFVLENFEHPHVQAFLLGWALAPQIRPDQQATGQLFYIMIPGIHVYGQAIPRGGSQMLANALAAYVEANGGKVMTSAPVARFLVENGRARGVRLADGTELRADRAVVTALDPKHSFLDLVEPGLLDEEFLRMVRGFSFGDIGVFRAHYALASAPVFRNGAEMSRTPFQRIFGSIEETEAHYADIALGRPPAQPFVWSACWTLVDPSRAPPGRHTLILDTFVPSRLHDGRSWTDLREEYARVLLARFREYTTNMDDANLLGSYVDTPVSMEADNPCLVGGATTGGERNLAQSGYFRPVPGYSQYRSPIRDLYMTGASCHPGGGISAMGVITAGEMLNDFGLARAPR
jgi:phytoene dehydrogenase-like protein